MLDVTVFLNHLVIHHTQLVILGRQRSCVETLCGFGLASAVTVETLAVKVVLLEAVFFGYSDLDPFLDCKNFITVIKSNGSTVELQGILHDICVLSSFSILSCSLLFYFLKKILLKNNNVVAYN